MTLSRPLILAAASALALVSLSGCASDFRANVSRFHQAIPPPEQGASFTIMPDDPSLRGSLEFAHYADFVAAHLTALGYKAAADPASAQLVVRIDYGVDKGRERVRSSGFGPSPFFADPFFYDPFYPSYYRGWRGRYRMGFYDPFMWGGGYDDVRSFTVYQSQLRMKIDKVAGGRVFEGTARAQSLSNKLIYLVPNLVDALFTDFPGKDGEDVKVTIAPEPKGKASK